MEKSAHGTRRHEGTGNGIAFVAEKTKHVKLKPHHAKPYRKRHYTLLAVSLIGIVLVLAFLVSYRDAVMLGVASSRQFVSSLFTKDSAAAPIKVVSSHGVSLSFDQNKYYGSAVDAATGKVYVGNELSRTAPYTSIQIAPALHKGAAGEVVRPVFTLTVHPNYKGTDSSALTAALTDGGLSSGSLTQMPSERVQYNGTDFIRTSWQAKASGLASAVTPQYSTYTAVKNGSLVTIVIAHGVVDAAADTSFNSILSSISFDTIVGALNIQTARADTSVYAPSKVASLLNFLTNTQATFAATNTTPVSASERVGALYSPAVVKVYNVYCMDITVNDAPFINGMCSASSGSGFIVTADGYVGTNGHVATADPRDLAISTAISSYISANDIQYLAYLLNMTDLRQSSFDGKTQQESLNMMVDAMYNIDASKFKAVNSIQNLLASVTPTPPDVTKLVEDTKSNTAYTGDKNVVSAHLLASDYRSAELYTGNLTTSDVALLKLDSGDTYPTVKLGSITDIAQGAELSIIGYPGEASDNGIVSSKTDTPTLTTGKVSSIKDASGSTKKLIETDTTIGHGNSGGPAINTDGLVVGIATYTADGSGKGNGTYNYIRDIADFKGLLDKQHVTPAESKTQIAWEAGMDKYYQSHYSSALKYFEQVQQLYPNHSNAAQFIASAQDHIKKGDDVSEFPVWIVWTGLAVLIAGASVAVVLIVRQKKHHAIYTAGVAQGTIQPQVVANNGQQVVAITSAPAVVPATPETPATPVAPVAPQPAAQSSGYNPFNTPINTQPTPGSDENQKPSF